MDRRGWVILVIVVILVGAVVVYWTRGQNGVATRDTTGQTIQAVFTCDEGKSVDAAFDTLNDEVKLTLSDGRSLTLPRALSASGARYANSDGSFVFWNKGNTAFITEGGTTTFGNCVTNS